MDEEQRSLLIRSFSHYSSSPGLELSYGARGFVGDESVLKSAAYRIGILAALRSMKSKSVTGVMITACGRSGVKNEVRIIDPDGGALIAEWEPLADSVANAVDPDEFVTLIEESVKKENISFDGGQPAEVLLARDTGPSGEALLEAAKQGISSVAGTIFHDMGILTTSQLHWLVHARNKGMKASEHDYFQNLSCSYRCLVDKIPEGSTADKIDESLVVDGANSVVGDKIEVLRDLCDGLAIEIRNTSKSGAILNQGVGVDFILEQKIVPSGFGSGDIGFRCASLDGYADRLLYFSVLPSQEIEIVDGNKILFLFTLFINEQLTVLREVENETEEGHYHARLGILQSAFEIGTSTNYLKSLGLDVVSFPPGTRSLQTVASKYDIGIYFEADGHGGILFSENYVSWLEAKNNELLSSSEGSRKQLTVSRLLAVSRMMNTTVSDALASLLLVEAILQNNGWSLQKWNEIYCDLANRQLNEVELADTTAFATENPKTVEISHSGTEEVADTFTDEARSKNAKDVSHLSQESKSIDNDPTESVVQQIVNYEAHTVEQPGVDAAVELEQNQDNGPTESAVQQIGDYEPHTVEQSNVDAAVELEQNQDNGPTESAVQQIVDYEAHTVEQSDVDVAVELEQNQERETTAYVQEKHESQNLHLHSDQNNLEASAEEESQDSCIKEGLAEERKNELNTELVVSLESHIGVSEDSCPVKVLEEEDDPNHAIDKEGIESKRRDADDDAWVIVNDGKGDCLNAGPVMTDARGYDHLPELGEPLNEKESCSSPELNGIHAPVENVDDLLLSADTDKAEEVKGISGLESACDGQTQSQKSNGLHLPDTRDYERLPELDEPSNEKESCSSPKVNGIHAPVEIVDDLIASDYTDKAEEAGVIGGSESACDAQPQSQTSSGVHFPNNRDYEQLPESNEPSNEKDGCLIPEVIGIRAPVENVDDLPVSADSDIAEEAGVIIGLESACDAQPHSQTSSVVHLPESEEPSNEKESCSSPKANSIHASAENVDDLIVSDDIDKAEVGVVNGLEFACDAQPQSQTSSGVHLPELDEPSNEKESCSSPKVNGMHASFQNINDLLVSADTDKAEACDAQPQSQTSSGDRVPSVIVHDEQLETLAQNGSVDVDNGEAASILSDVGTTEETGDFNVVECASCTIAPPEVNDIVVTLPPFEHAAKVEIIAENSPVDIDNDTDTVNFLSSVVNSVEASVETRKKLPIPFNVDDTEEAGATNDSAGIKPPSDIHCSLSSSLVNDSKLGSEAENSGIDVEKGIDGNLPVDKAEDLSNPNYLVEVERSVADGAGTAKHDSEVNGGISELPVVQVSEPETESVNNPADVVQVSEPEIESENNPVDVDNKSESTTPQFQVNSHDAQETHLESKAENTPVSSDKRSDCLIGSSNLYTNMRFGSLEFVGNMCLKSEASIKGSRDVDHDDSASSNLGKAEANIKVVEAFDETNTQQHVADNQSDHKAEGTLLRGSGEFHHDDSAMSAVANMEGDINERIAMNGIVHAVRTNVDEESTSSLEGSATAVVDGESVVDEIVRKPFYYLIRIPKYDDEKLTEQIRSAEMLLEEKMRNRDAVLTEYRQQKESCQKLKANQQAAILEERGARDLFRAKRKEIDSAQSLVNIAKDAMTIEDLENKVANMEHKIQHETMPLNVEKQLIREIKQSKQQREQLLATSKKQGVQEALDHKDENEDRVKVLRKEMDALKHKLSEAELGVKTAVKILVSEHARLNELHRQLTLSNNDRQEAYSNLQKLRSQWSEKNQYFWSCKNVQRQANTYAVSGNKTSLQSVCIDQVESVMKLWNRDNDFRRDYMRCNLRSTLRRFGTSDGRSLGLDEEAPQLAMTPIRRINTPVKEIKEIKAVTNQPQPVADTKPAKKVVEEQKKPNVVTNKPKKASLVKTEEAQASDTVKIEEEDKEELKARKEKEELARNEEELRKREETERLKEIRRLEENAKFQEALERKRRNAEKAQAKAELRAKKEAKEKEKEREKRARKKENKKRQKSEDTTSNPDSEKSVTDAQSEQQQQQPKEEAETREKSVTVIKRSQKPYAKQNKLKTILPPPPPLRNRGRRRTQQWVWVAVTIVAILILFFLGNLNLPEITGFFSSLY